MNKLLIVLFFICMIFTGCWSRVNDQLRENFNSDIDEIYFLNFEQNLKNPPTDTFVINNIAKDISFIPIERSTEVLLTVVDFRVARIDDSYYISSMAGGSRFSGIIRLDTMGRFKEHVVQIGRGPKELPRWFEWSCNNTLNQIVASSLYDIIVYSFENDVTNKYSLSGYFGKGFLLSDGNIVGLPKITGTGDVDTPYLCFLNQEGEVIKSLYYPQKRNIFYDIWATQGRDVGPLEVYGLYAGHSGDALFEDMYNDTIYRVSSINEIHPYIILGRGSLAPKVKEVLDRKAKVNRVTLRRVLETEKYLFIVYEYKDLHYSGIWEKQSSTLIGNMETDFFKIPVINNRGFTMYLTPNGDKIPIGIAGYSDGKLYGVLGANQAMEFLPDIDEYDNPVLMVIELK